MKNLKYYIYLYLSKLTILLINLYQNFSFLLKPTCRFMPTCSEYAKEAFKTHGLFIGLKLTIKRLLSCRPFGKSGFDPVPMPSSERKNDGY